MCSSPPAGASAAVAAAVDELVEQDLFALGAQELLTRVREMVTARNRLDAELARTVRRGELARAFEHDGMVSAQSWLRGHCRLSVPAAGRLVRNGRALEQLPAVAAAHAAGRVSAEQVTVIGKVTDPENLARAAEQDVDLPGIDATFAAIAANHGHSDTARAVAHYLARLDADGPEPDPTVGRSLSLATHPDGRVSGRFDLDPVGGEKVRAVIESLVQAGRVAGDERSRAQQQGDALVQWADVTLAAGDVPRMRRVRPHVALRVGADDLVDPSTGPATAELGFGAVISAARARWAACDADITRIVLDPDGLPLDVGRTLRLVPRWLRTAVEHRDGHCVFAGCDAPTWWCEVHHLIHWALGGETSLENSGLLCERHHTQVHHGFRVERDECGEWHTHRPDGSEILLPTTQSSDDPEQARAG